MKTVNTTTGHAVETWTGYTQKERRACLEHPALAAPYGEELHLARRMAESYCLQAGWTEREFCDYRGRQSAAFSAIETRMLAIVRELKLRTTL